MTKTKENKTKVKNFSVKKKEVKKELKENKKDKVREIKPKAQKQKLEISKKEKKKTEKPNPAPVEKELSKTVKVKEKKPDAKKSKVKVMALGGLHEIGKNLTLIEYDEHMIIIDCGLAFPDDEMLGVDLVIPDFSYLEQNANKIHAILLTHGHEDHIGAIPFLLRSVDAPIYGTALTLGILKRKLEEYKLPNQPDLRPVIAGDVISLGVFKAEFIHVNHSIADACAISVKTPAGIIFHTGDFKLDVSPIDGQMMDLARIGEIGNEGVLLMLGESTNAERYGFTPSERHVGRSLDSIFSNNKDKRIIIATFSSNVHRVQQIIDASVKHGRKVAILGRSMTNVVGAATELEYMNLPPDTIIDIKDIKRYNNENLTLITTGSQGEPMSALYRMAFAEHDKVKLGPKDLVVLSSSPIPGNEKLIGKIVNALVKAGIKVVNDSVADVHVSGHACSEELKLMLGLVKPKFFMPIHGEVKHLYAHKEIAEFMGISPKNIFIGENGMVLELDRKSAKWNGSVTAGQVLVDGSGVGEVGNIVLRDRRHLSQDGIIVVAATVDIGEGLLISGPDIVSRGFVYVRESEALMEDVRKLAQKSIIKSLDDGVRDWNELKNTVRDALSSAIYSKTKRKPMILPVFMDL
ncbi:MAG: ribonuclease J [Clostridia bacterium]|nr:ribonuclease J [Clostridia bacterium]